MRMSDMCAHGVAPLVPGQVTTPLPSVGSHWQNSLAVAVRPLIFVASAQAAAQMQLLLPPQVLVLALEQVQAAVCEAVPTFWAPYCTPVCAALLTATLR